MKMSFHLKQRKIFIATAVKSARKGMFAHEK